MAMSGKRKKLGSEELWSHALKLLGQRAYSAGELRRKLFLRAESAQILDTTMAKLREYGLADDKTFSEAFSAARLRGQARVLRDLQAKQVSSGVAKSAVETTFAGTDETELIERYLAKKFRGKDLNEFLKEEKNQAKLYRRLRTAGFSSSNSFAMGHV